jgi:acetate kinase
MDATILTLNGGSSSLKFAAYRLTESGENAVLIGAAEAIGAPDGKFWVRAEGKQSIERRESFAGPADAIPVMFAALQEQGITRLSGAGHRIVHGGPWFSAPHLIDTTAISRLRKAAVFAPIHVPREIALIEAIAQHYPDLTQVACFDTAFHSQIPEVARRFPLPRKFWEEGVKRYGFHGLSYEYVVERMGQDVGRRAIIAHLGNGSSMVALKEGKPVDTSMGLTPTGGFMMGTRTGDLDPGVTLYLLRSGHSVEQVAEVLDYRSGLLGVSGLSSEMRTLLDSSEQNADAAQAVEMFCYQVRKFIGAYAAALGGLDTVVFTGGIGEHAAAVRAGIVDSLEFLGIELDAEANSRNAQVISAKTSRCTVRVIRTDEDLMIARHTRRILGL